MSDNSSKIIEPRDIINYEIFDTKEPEEKNKKTFWKEVLRDGIIAIVVIAVGINILPILNGAATIFNEVLLSATGVEMEIPDTAPIAFDVKKFLESAVPTKDSKGELISYVSSYASAESLGKDTGLYLPEDEGDIHNVYDGLLCRNIQVELNIIEKYGKITVVLSYESSALEENIYTLNGLFMIEGYTPEDAKLPFEQGKATSVLEYGDTRKAYVVKNWGFGTQTIFFENDGIFYNFEVSDTEEMTAKAVALLEAMTEY